MMLKRDELVAEVEMHVRKLGGAFGEWSVGTAMDSCGPFFRRHLEADLGDGLAWREAFSSDAAQVVLTHLVNDCGMQLDTESVPEPGRVVFVYRKMGHVR